MFDKILNNLNDIVTIWEIQSYDDLDDLANKMICKKVNNKIEDCVGKSFKERFPNALENRELMETYVKVFLTKEEHTFELLYEDGLYRLKMFLISDFELCTISTPLNEQIKAEHEAERLNRARSYFLANVSHEIRTPLNGVIGMIELLCDTNLTEQQIEYTEMIKESGYSLMAIINDVLDFSKLEANQMSIKHDPFYIRDCIEATFDIINIKASRKNLNISYFIDPTVPPYIKSDFQRIKQVLINLLSNAVKFTNKGNVTLLVQIDQNDEGIEPDEYSPPISPNSSYDSFWSSNSSDDTNHENNIKLLFKVIDTGIGISKDNITKIFDSFQQVNQSRSQQMINNNGTGLGLSIAKKLVELMNGEMRIKSKLGEGSTFSFTILAEECDNMKEDIPSELMRGTLTLIVDDNELNRVMLCTTLLKWGSTPIPCSSADEALAYIRGDYHFHMAFIDIIMPNVNGFKLAKKIRNLRPDLPMIALSSIDTLPKERAPFKLFLTKPIKEKHLFNSCASIIGNISHANTQNNNLSYHINSKVLVAEDVYINQKVILGHLANLGFNDISIASDGKQAYQMLKEQEYNLLFLDIKMPKMSGVQLLDKIREEGVKVPYIIAVTADVSKSAKDYYVGKCKMNDYLSKPVTLKNIKKAIERFLDREKNV